MYRGKQIGGSETPAPSPVAPAPAISSIIFSGRGSVAMIKLLTGIIKQPIKKDTLKTFTKGKQLPWERKTITSTN